MKTEHFLMKMQQNEQLARADAIGAWLYDPQPILERAEKISSQM